MNDVTAVVTRMCLADESSPRLAVYVVPAGKALSPLHQLAADFLNQQTNKL